MEPIGDRRRSLGRVAQHCAGWLVIEKKSFKVDPVGDDEVLILLAGIK